MDYYKKYLSAVEYVFTQLESIQQQHSAESESKFAEQERNLRQQYERKLAILNLEMTDNLQKMERKQLNMHHEDDSKKKALRNMLTQLDAQAHSLKTEYDEIAKIANEKSQKRARIRSRLFKFWWSGKD